MSKSTKSASKSLKLKEKSKIKSNLKKRLFDQIDKDLNRRKNSIGESLDQTQNEIPVSKKKKVRFAEEIEVRLISK